MLVAITLNIFMKVALAIVALILSRLTTYNIMQLKLLE